MAVNKSRRAHSMIATIRYLHPHQGSERHNRTHLLRHHPLAHSSNKRKLSTRSRKTRKHSKKTKKSNK